MKYRWSILLLLVLLLSIYLISMNREIESTGASSTETIRVPVIELNTRIELEFIELHNQTITLLLRNKSKEEILFPENYNLQIFIVSEDGTVTSPGAIHVEFQSGSGDQILSPFGSESYTQLIKIEFEDNPYNMLDGRTMAFSALGFVESNIDRPTQAVLYFP